jgi:hypothetical protein
MKVNFKVSVYDSSRRKECFTYLENNPLLRSDVMRSYGISGHLSPVSIHERQFDSPFGSRLCTNLDWYKRPFDTQCDPLFLI